MKNMASKRISKLLSVNYYYYPQNAIGARRIINVVSQLAGVLEGVQVLVLSTGNHVNSASTDAPPIHKGTALATFDLSNWLKLKKNWFFKNNKDSEPFISPAVEPVNSQKAFRVRYANIFKSLPGNLIFGEGGWLYIMAGFFKGLRFINNETLIFSSYSPLSDHIIAFLLKTFYPKAIWVADFRDLYIQKDVRDVIGFSFHKWFFKRLMKRADLVTTVSAGLAIELQKFAPRVSVLTNGISPGYLDKHTTKKRFSKFRISYTGSLYGYKRNPAIIFRSLNNLLKKRIIDEADLEIIYAGSEGSLWDKYLTNFELQPVSKNLGSISRTAARQLQEDSIMNVVITWADEHNKGILTGKFFEYIEAGNLILVIINGNHDVEFEKLVSETRVGNFFYNSDNEKLENYIAAIYDEWKRQGYVDPGYNKRALKQFTWGHQVSEGIIKPLNLQSKTNVTVFQLPN